MEQITDPDRALFVISDLHIGNGSPRDSLLRAHREDLLHHFLDHVQENDGQLIVAGDLMELWMFPMDQVIHHWTALLDRLDQLQAIYIPGNHDAQVGLCADDTDLHPLLQRVQAPFTQVIGERSFHFMHGHELDPFVPTHSHQWQRSYRYLTQLTNCRHRIPLSIHDRIADFLMECGEHLLRIGHRLGANLQHALHEELTNLCEAHPSLLDMSTRTLKLLSRQFHYRDQVEYDVAVAGHTHRPGQFCRCYYNSGSWAKATNNFLRIEPDGHTQLFDWGHQGAALNPTQIGVR